MAAGFTAFLPLTLERVYPHGTDRAPAAVIAPVFRGYLLVEFDPAANHWRRIGRCRGIGGLLCDPSGRPQAIPPGVVEALQARTSARRIVDDPGAEAPTAASERPHWHDLTALSAPARTALLLRLFDRADVAA